MRLIGLLLALVVLGFVIKIYLNSSSVTVTGEGTEKTHPQQMIDQAEQSVEQINQALQHQQQVTQDSD